MPTERQRREIVARCVATMVYYHNSPRSQLSAEMMMAEVRVIAGFVDELGVPIVEIEASIIRPLRVELAERYGRELGPRLLNEFVDAFDFRGRIVAPGLGHGGAVGSAPGLICQSAKV